MLSRPCHELRRRGLTLVELLVVITILMLVTAATVPLMAPVTGQRKVRESARLLAGMLAQAQARALSSGRPVGVWIERLSSQDGDARANTALDLFLCEVPPPYTGLDPNAECSISQGPGNNLLVDIHDKQRRPDVIPQGWVHGGDRIRLNYRGPYYSISDQSQKHTNDPDPVKSLTGQQMAIAVRTSDPWPPGKAPVPFQILRQPVKTADEPASLPIGAIVDLGFSGIGNDIEPMCFAVRVPATGQPDPRNPTSLATGWAGRPVCIVFGPSGNLDSIYFGYRRNSDNQLIFEAYRTTTPVYLLIAQSPNDTGTSPPSVLNTENVWVAINPQSGLVTTSEVAALPDPNVTIDWSRPQDVKDVLRLSRSFARSAQNMGGR
jgi:type II secretion system protein H